MNLVEGEGFIQLLQEMDSQYTIPSSRSLTRDHLPQLMEQEKKKLQDQLQESDWVGITTDLWSSRTNSAFMTITVHFLSKEWTLETKVLACERFSERHTGENLKERLEATLDSYNVKNKVVAVTTDNAMNIKNAVKGAGMVDIGCMAHTLNLCAQELLDKDDSLKAARKKIKETATMMKTSHCAKVNFEESQKRLGMEVKALVQEVKTRWNSTFHMLERALEVRDALVLFYTDTSYEDHALSSDEWAAIRVGTKVLAPLHEATKEMSSEHFVTGSKVVPVVKNLLGWYAEEAREWQQRGNSDQGYKLCKALLDILNRRFHAVEEVKELVVATICDPRFKKQGFRSAEKADRAVRWLKQEMEEVDRIDRVDTPQVQEVTAEKRSSLWSRFDAEVTTRNSLPTPSPDTREAELRRYFELPNLPRQQLPLAWWKQEESNFKRLSKIASKYLMVQGTSVPSERVFSAAGAIISEKRSRINDENANMLIFLNANLKKK